MQSIPPFNPCSWQKHEFCIGENPGENPGGAVINKLCLIEVRPIAVVHLAHLLLRDSSLTPVRFTPILKVA